METDKFTLEFGLSDFESLNHTSTQSFYSQQSDRFEWNNSQHFGKNYNDKIDLQTKCVATDPKFPQAKHDLGWYMYWIGTNDLNALVAEKILQAAGHKVYRLWDLAENPEPEWCLLCDYQSKYWNKGAE